MKISPPDGWAVRSFSALQLDRPEWRAALGRIRGRLVSPWDRTLFDRLAREYAFCLLERTGQAIDFEAACERAFRLYTADERAEMLQ